MRVAAPKATPNRLRPIPPIARCACGEVVIASELRPAELAWCGECRGFVDAVITAGRGGLTSVALPPDGINLNAHLLATELSLIRQALERAGTIHAAAQLLGLKRTTLTERIRKYLRVAPDLARFKGQFPFRALPGAS